MISLAAGLLDFVALFITLIGYSLGLGAVTVIEIHAWLGRHSEYWTEATIRTHKVTKPLIWTGLILAAIGSVALYRSVGFTALATVQLIVGIVLIGNGFFLTAYASPTLLKQEGKGRAAQILSKNFQRIIFWSFMLSWLCWWSEALLFTLFLFQR